LKGPFEYRLMKRGEETEICDLALRVFEEFVAPQFSKEGVQEFRNHADPHLFLRRSQWNHFILIATTTQKEIVGMIEMRDYIHVALFFVDAELQCKGIGGELLRRAVAVCRRRNPEIATVTVNSAPNAVEIYERLGFRRAGPERCEDHIRSAPMTLDLFRSGPQSSTTGKVKQKVLPSPSADSTQIRPP
jgi:GNAT superfamily N-acetyltransferase